MHAYSKCWFTTINMFTQNTYSKIHIFAVILSVGDRVVCQHTPTPHPHPPSPLGVALTNKVTLTTLKTREYSTQQS